MYVQRDYKLIDKFPIEARMFRFVGFKTVERKDDTCTLLLLDNVPDKKELLGEFKISRFCSGLRPFISTQMIACNISFFLFYVDVVPRAEKPRKEERERGEKEREEGEGKRERVGEGLRERLE